MKGRFVLPKFSVILPVKNDNRYLPKALDALIHQTDENFEVVIVDGGSTDGSLDTAAVACEKYVGFYLIKGNFETPFEAMNRGLKSAEGDYVLFLSAKDFITDETIEKLCETIDASEKKPDVVVFRNYLFGEGMLPHFDEYEDKLAPLPEAPKYEYLFLRAFTLGNKCYRKAFLENRRLYFDTENPYSDYLFIFRAFLFARHVMGCPNAFHERQILPLQDSRRDTPTKEHLLAFCDMFSEIYSIAAETIAQDSQAPVDGDESYLQEVLYRWICNLYEKFYRYFWLMDDETYALFVEKYQQLMQKLQPEKQKKLNAQYAYIGAPHIFASRHDAEFLCMLALSFPQKEQYAPFLESLYHQTFPFFEIAVRESFADAVPQQYRSMPNLCVLPDDNFFPAARQRSKSHMLLVVKDGTPLHLDALKELSESHAPMFLRQSVFAKIRKSAQVKMSLKEKGLDI